MRRSQPVLLALLAAAAVALSACSNAATDTAADGRSWARGLGPSAQVAQAQQRAAARNQSLPSPPALPAPLGARPSSSPAQARVTKVLTVVLENRSTAAVQDQMPYLRGLGQRYGVTTAYRAVAHPSLPNYLAMAGGSTYGVSDDAAPSRHPVGGPSVFDLALARGRTAKIYAEAMPGSCGQAATTRYAVKHNPWAYFTDAASRANCRRFDVPSGTPQAGALRNDIAAGALPTVGMLVPDICNDGHDCPLATADRWLRGWVDPIMAGPDYRAGRLAIVVTFDEDDRRDGNRVPTTVVAPTLRGRTVGTALTHCSWTRWAAELAGATPPRAAASATSLGTAFRLTGR